MVANGTVRSATVAATTATTASARPTARMRMCHDEYPPAVYYRLRRKATPPPATEGFGGVTLGARGCLLRHKPLSRRTALAMRTSADSTARASSSAMCAAEFGLAANFRPECLN